MAFEINPSCCPTALRGTSKFELLLKFAYFHTLFVKVFIIFIYRYRYTLSWQIVFLSVKRLSKIVKIYHCLLQ